MQQLKRTIEVPPNMEISSIWAIPENYDRRKGMIVAHGAGNDMTYPLLSYVHEQLAERGLMTVKFNFPYTERGRRAPDRRPLLEAAWRAVIEAVLNDPTLAPAQLFLAGKSLGGRIASLLAAQGMKCAGLIFLGYPLHPPNKPEQPRIEHWPNIPYPMLFIQGTRDALCDLGLLKAALKSLQVPVSLHEIEGGDHSFKVPKRLQRDEREVWDEILDTLCKWLASINFNQRQG